MPLKNIRRVYFLGIGGIGMSALSRWFNHHGYAVAGYDKIKTELTTKLETEGLIIHYEDAPTNIPFDYKNRHNTLVIYTPAIPKDCKELNYFIHNSFKIKKRSEVLGILTETLFTIAIAGTHGKTTVSSMIAHLLRSAGKDCTAFIGGIMQDYDSNVLLGSSLEKTICVVEADEFDRSFLTLKPNMGVVTNVDSDHLDTYSSLDEVQKSFAEFVNIISDNVFIHVSIISDNIFLHENIVDKLKPQSEKMINYGLDRGNIKATHVKAQNHSFIFDWISTEKIIKDLVLKVPGFHNVENMTVAIALAMQLGVHDEEIKKGVKTYSGVRRRFEYVIQDPKVTYIDDYAHHPVELDLFIKSVRELYPHKKLTAVFQPHLFSRTRDFYNGFAKSLSLADELILLDIYPAREQPIKGVSSDMIFSSVTCQKSKSNLETVVNDILERNIEIIMTIGAGNIDTIVKPLKTALKEKYIKIAALEE